jgi:HSP20 family molecular chaperone IbpA
MRRPADPSFLSLLRDGLHALFSDLHAPATRGREGAAVDVVDGTQGVEIRIDLLALAPDDLVVEVDGDILRLTGSRIIEADESMATSRLHVRKRWHFRRGIQLPRELDPASAVTHYAHGQLTIRLRKR